MTDDRSPVLDPRGEARRRHPASGGRAVRPQLAVVASQPPEHAADVAAGSAGTDDVLVIDCDDCARQGSDACGDCVVTFLCDRDAGGPVVVDLATERTVRLLGEVGLVPTLKHLRGVPRTAGMGR